ncbi:MAG: hypothetical protein WCJ83_00930 [Actinomycetes bacterium]
MEQRLKKFVAVFLFSVMALSTTSAIAASPTATPKPSTKTTAKETKKPATKKPVVKKKVVKKKKKKKLPPLQPVVCFGKAWPPTGFTQNDEVFAKIPTAEQLGCESSDNYTPAKVFLRADLRKCDEFACGAVTVASEARCTWWEVTSTFERIDLRTGKIEATLGTLRTISQGTNAKVLQSIMLISGIKHRDADGKILNNIKASGIAVSCHHDAIPDLSNRNFFTAS